MTRMKEQFVLVFHKVGGFPKLLTDCQHLKNNMSQGDKLQERCEFERVFVCKEGNVTVDLSRKFGLYICATSPRL